jgi:hypothetical protein
VYWIAFCQMHGPLGPERLDLAAARVCSQISIINGAWGGKYRSVGELMDQWSQVQRPAVSDTECQAREGNDIAGVIGFRDWAVGMAQFAAGNPK